MAFGWINANADASIRSTLDVFVELWKSIMRITAGSQMKMFSKLLIRLHFHCSCYATNSNHLVVLLYLITTTTFARWFSSQMIHSRSNLLRFNESKGDLDYRGQAKSSKSQFKLAAAFLSFSLFSVAMRILRANGSQLSTLTFTRPLLSTSFSCPTFRLYVVDSSFTFVSLFIVTKFWILSLVIDWYLGLLCYLLTSSSLRARWFSLFYKTWLFF